MMFEMTIPPLTRSLTNLMGFLDKAAEYADHKKFETEVLLNARLAPDQLNFIKQVQIACDVSKLGVARLTGKEAPKFEDTEKTLAEVKTRIEATMKYLKSITTKDFTGAEAKSITTPNWEGKSMLGIDFVAASLLPNFYFHVTMAYAFLRHNGVELGKKDFLGALPFQS